jgi:hypothetical protein
MASTSGGESRSTLYLVLLLGGLAAATVAVLLIPGDGAPPTEDAVDASRFDVSDPTEEGEVQLEGYRQVLSRDQIAPVYSPEFVDGDEIEWPDETLVIGVAGAEDAKAYPVSHLNAREMVNDEIEGEPILVTW